MISVSDHYPLGSHEITIATLEHLLMDILPIVIVNVTMVTHLTIPLHQLTTPLDTIAANPH